MAEKKIKYTEPGNYFPKEIRDKYFKKSGTAKKTTTTTTTKKK